MKKELLITLLLAVALVVPALGQQTSTPPAQSDQNLQSPAGEKQQVSPREPLKYEQKEGFWGKINPFARKKYVQRQLDPVRGRVNELDELTEQNARMIKDVDSRATEGIRVATAKANEADMHAVDAGNRAQLAHQTASQASTRLQSVEQVVTNIDQFQPVSETEIRFRAGQATLSRKAKVALDDLATPLKDQKGYIIEVQGFSSGSGRTALENSQRMADSVVRYLVLEHEIPVYRIFVVGMGNTPVRASAEGERPQRIRGGKVEIALLKNGVGDLETQPIATPSAAAQPAGETSMPSETQSEVPAEPATGTTPTVPPSGQQEQQPPASPSPK
ncbi:MAG TPA: OmpA family protein [Terriglobales bacterium]|jgi:outer membrane protein OmpA-like peptidoglycan-associated protein|nr:OmpA family protein [Terriglobales bacterium]